MKKRHELFFSVVAITAFSMFCLVTKHPQPLCNGQTSAFEKVNAAHSSNEKNDNPVPGEFPDPQDWKTGRKRATRAFAEEINGHASVWFDYDRGLETVEKPWPLSFEMKRAETRGAHFKFSFLVVDEKGSPIESADVAIVAYQRRGSEVYSSKTGADGVAVIKGFGTGEIRVEIDKSGFFHMSLSHWIFKPRLRCVSGRRWQPWNPTIEVQLTPVPSTRSAMELKSDFRSRNGAGLYGFDLVSGVPSTSTNCDMLITVTELPPDTGQKYPNHGYAVFFPGEGNGAQIVKKNLFRACPYPPIAPENGYTNRLEFSGWNPIAEDETVVFRIRNSKAEEPLYGVFRYPFLPIGTGLSFLFDVVVNVERGLKTLVPAVETATRTKFFKLTPLENGVE